MSFPAASRCSPQEQEKKSNYLSAYSLGGEEGCGEKRGRNEKEKGGKEIDYIRELYLPAIYPARSWPCSSQSHCFS